LEHVDDRIKIMESELKINAEVLLEIHHYLLSRTGRIEDIKKVCSHPQPIAQCRNWLSKNLPHADLKDVSSTAVAAQLAQQEPGAAAVASRQAAVKYGLRILFSDIEGSTRKWEQEPDAMRVAVAVRPDLPAGAANSVQVRNFVDDAIFGKLRKLRIAPSQLSSDSQFIRRVYLDTIGTLPTAEESLAFLKDSDSNKRDKLVDSLLDRPEFAQFWALKWGDLFMIRDIYNMNNTAFAHEYFRRNFAEDRPYTEVAREMLTGVGSLADVGPNNRKLFTAGILSECSSAYSTVT
jgi:hypothetical protein